MRVDRIIQGDALAELIKMPAESVHCVVTSPPYWGLRDYGEEAQLGLEATPEEYVARMVEVFREVRRVLRSDGTLWLNMGDSYNSGTTSDRKPSATDDYGKHGYWTNPNITKRCNAPILKPKDLCGMPWRLAFALQADGWWLRCDIVWHKKNPMPESVTDRPTKAHEYLFLLSKSARYYYDAEAIKEDAAYPDGPNAPGAIKSPMGQGFTRRAKVNGYRPGRSDGGARCNKPGQATRNKRSVWTISTAPFSEAHFATFPEALVEPCIRAGTSERGVCPECGAPWVRVVESVGVETRPGNVSKFDNADDFTDGQRRKTRKEWTNHTTGWRPSCDHGGEPIPATVLEPFCGAATTPLVAKKLGRRFVAIELSAEYIEISNRRLREVALFLEYSE